MGLLRDLSESHRERRPDDLRQARSFETYLEDAIQNPRVGRNAHQRVADMFDHFGTEYDTDAGIVKYDIAAKDPLNDGENEFYGEQVHQQIHEFVNKIKSGSRGLGPEKRIKLLLGPVGSGKSHFDEQVREYFEEYTARDEGRMYTWEWKNLDQIPARVDEDGEVEEYVPEATDADVATDEDLIYDIVIDDQDPSDSRVRAPMNQDPLALLPQEEREQVIEQMNENLDAPYTIRNDQAMDPASQFYMDKLKAKYDDDLEAVMENHVDVVRFIADENKREGIETFEPKDKKNQDETELTGDVNYSKLAIYGESDPRAFDFSGAFCNANRGIFSGEELLKLQREFLYDFLHASQEQTIKPKNNPRMDIDQVIVGRTNMPEYKDKAQDEKMEAFNDRTKRIDFPYVLEYDEEANVYRKMLRNADTAIDLGDEWGEANIEPHTLEMAALWSVLTRIEDPSADDTTLIQKAKAYNGDIDDNDEIDERKLREQGDDAADIGEGMEGVSARFTGDEIAEALMEQINRGKEHLSYLQLQNFLEKNLPNHASIPEENLGTYERHLELVAEEYKNRAIEDVRHALAYDFEEIERQGEKYLDHTMAYIDDDTIEDELTGREQNPDETFLNEVESHLEVPGDRKDDFRQEVANWVSRRARDGKSFDPRENDRLRSALEKKLWEDKKHNINFSALVSANELDDEERNQWIDALMDQGYSEDGAAEVLQYAGAEVAKSNMED